MIKPTITIGIPAHNEEANIGFLLDDLSKQVCEGFEIEKIIVASDGSTDDTTSIVYNSKNTKVVLINGKENLGKAYRQNEIISKTTSDILVLLDADTRIPDKSFIQTLVEPIANGEASMTSPAINELTTRNIFEKSLEISMKLKSNLFKEFKKGNNVYNCHGPARAFAKKLYPKFQFTQSEGEDMYSYFVCKKLNMKFVFVSDAKILYRLPSNPEDHYKQSSRFIDSINTYKKFFGNNFVNKELQIPTTLYFRVFIKSLPYIMTNIISFAMYLTTYLGVRISTLAGIKTKNSWGVTSSKSIQN